MSNIYVLLLLGYTRLFTVMGGGDYIYKTPVSLFNAESGVNFYAGFNANITRENWTILTYDKYDNTVGAMGIYGDVEHYINYPDLRITYKRQSMSFALSYLTYLDFHYTYDVNKKDMNYITTSTTSDDQNGQLKLLGVSVGYEYRNFKGGISLNYGLGKNDFGTATVYKFNGIVPFLMLGYAEHTFGLTATYNPKSSLKNDVEYDLAQAIYINGYLFKPSALEDKVNLSFFYKFMNQTSPFFKKQFGTSLSLSHTFFNNLSLEIGGGVESAYQRSDIFIPSYYLNLKQPVQQKGLFSFSVNYRPTSYGVIFDGESVQDRESSILVKTGFAFRIL